MCETGLSQTQRSISCCFLSAVIKGVYHHHLASCNLLTTLCIEQSLCTLDHKTVSHDCAWWCNLGSPIFRKWTEEDQEDQEAPVQYSVHSQFGPHEISSQKYISNKKEVPFAATFWYSRYLSISKC